MVWCGVRGLCDDDGRSVSVRALSQVLMWRAGQAGMSGDGVDASSSVWDLEQAMLDLASRSRLKGWKKVPLPSPIVFYNPTPNPLRIWFTFL